MKRLIIILISLLTLSTNVFSQKRIIINRSPQIVPNGKKWTLLANMSTIIELSEGALESGNLYNAQIFSRPGLLSFITEGDFYRPNKMYQVLFNDINKAPYTNDYTFEITSIESFKSNWVPSLDFTSQSSLIFYPGQKVFVTGCLESIQLVERPCSIKEEIAFKKNQEKQEEIESVPNGKTPVDSKISNNQNTNASIRKNLEISSVGQKSDTSEITIIDDKETNSTFATVEQQAHYQGGENSFNKFLSKKIKYPTVAKLKKIEGKVFIHFIVEKDGSLTNFKVAQGLGWGCDEEALRVMKLSPKWLPSVQNGKPIRTEMLLAVPFTLTNAN